MALVEEEQWTNLFFSTVADCSRRATESRLGAVARQAVDAPHMYKHVHLVLERQNAKEVKAQNTHGLRNLLYMISEIVQLSLRQNQKADKYSARLAPLAAKLVKHLAASQYQDQTERLLRLWRKKKVFSEEMLASMMQQVQVAEVQQAQEDAAQVGSPLHGVPILPLGSGTQRADSLPPIRPPSSMPSQPIPAAAPVGLLQPHTTAHQWSTPLPPPPPLPPGLQLSGPLPGPPQLLLPPQPWLATQHFQQYSAYPIQPAIQVPAAPIESPMSDTRIAPSHLQGPGTAWHDSSGGSGPYGGPRKRRWEPMQDSQQEPQSGRAAAGEQVTTAAVPQAPTAAQAPASVPWQHVEGVAARLDAAAAAAAVDPVRAELDADLLEYVAVTEAVSAAAEEPEQAEELYDPLAV